MTPEQYTKACDLQGRRRAVERELTQWESNDFDVCGPLNAENVSDDVKQQVREVCAANLRAQLAAIDVEFQQL
jgi:hypothetical protein